MSSLSHIASDLEKLDFHLIYTPGRRGYPSSLFGKLFQRWWVCWCRVLSRSYGWSYICSNHLYWRISEYVSRIVPSHPLFYVEIVIFRNPNTSVSKFAMVVLPRERFLRRLRGEWNREVVFASQTETGWRIMLGVVSFISIESALSFDARYYWKA